MCAASVHCLTRVIVDDDVDLEIAQLSFARQRIEASLASFPPQQRNDLVDALLNLGFKLSRAHSCYARPLHSRPDDHTPWADLIDR